jgi:lipoprotein-anchoring transpeptidase ErfK/SrfK
MVPVNIIKSLRHLLGWRKRARRRRVLRLVLRWSLIVCFGLFLTAASFAVRTQFATDSVYAQFEQSRKSVDRARSLEAERYSPELYRSMNETWERAGMAFKAANTNNFYERDYSRAEGLAVSARRMAVAASLQAVEVRSTLARDIKAQLAVVNSRLCRFKSEYEDVPMDKALRKNFILGEMLAAEGESAFARGDYPKAIQKVQLAGSYLGSADSRASKVVEACYVNAPKWKEWASETIEWSARQDSRAIVVDKIARACRVYHDGRLEVEFPVEMGTRWLGPKRYRGDYATPEGRYRITKKKGNGETTYYKALEINYPNDQDWELFRIAKRRGEISAGAKIGGLIQIHGEGGRGADWTQGCIALTNGDMDRLYRLVGIGTPVTIVGSSRGRIPISSAKVPGTAEDAAVRLAGDPKREALN